MADPGTLFAKLNPALPLALLPIRIETRFYLDEDPPAVRVRFFPDVLHADGHVAALTPTERALGGAFWERTWRAGDDLAGADAAFTWLAGRLGPWRAAWVAQRLQPTNPAEAPTLPVPDGRPLQPAPRLAKLEEGTAAGEPTRARLLPDRIAVVGYGRDIPPIGTWWGEPIPEDLAMAPGLVEADGDIDGRGLLDAQGLAWVYDFTEAERVGMALTIDLSRIDAPIASDGFRRMIAVGIRTDDQREGLEALLTAHRYTHGLDFIPQQTPTNTTETSAEGMSLQAPSLSAVRAAELDRGDPADRPAVDADGDLYRMTAADAASVALGLGRDNALDRATKADMGELARAEAMNRSLWPATGGHYFDHLMQGALTSGARAWLRDWSTAFVRGAGPLPTLLVGSQPYGLLPVGPAPLRDEVPQTEVEHVAATLESLRGDWVGSIEAVARLDPDSTDAVPEDEDEDETAAIVSRVLGAVPHPTAFRLAQVDDERPTYASEWEARLERAEELCRSWPDPAGNGYGDHPDNFAFNAWQTCDARLASSSDVDLQASAVREFAENLGLLLQDSDLTAGQQAASIEARDYAQTALVDFVDAHEARQLPLGWLVLDSEAITGEMGDSGDPSAFFALRPFDAPFELALVAGGRTAGDLALLREWLEKVATELADPEPPGYDFSIHFPLLRQLLRRSVAQATDPGDAALLADGLAALRAIVDAAGDPVGELEGLMREALGPWAYRFDAWVTGVAAWRLENKRQARPRGIQVGAFGWLVDVKPRDAPGASQGYVLAPSLSHATSAAILRSGWSAFGEGLEVDLSSDRIRRAQWIADGVRQGQDLGRLLGARFERGLQDAGLAGYADEFRKLALDAVGSQAAASAIVDGLLLARAREGADDLTDHESAAQAAVADLIAGAPAEDVNGLEAALDSLVTDLDATADAAVAQSVFSLTQGNLPEATATLTAAATGETSFPPLRFADTPREALTITHRLLLLLDPEAAAGWPRAGRSGRAGAAPALEAWLAGLIGDPAEYRFAVRFEHPGTGETVAGPVAATLADVGLGALDLIFLAPVGEQTDLGRLGAVLTAWAQRLRPPALPDAAMAVLVTDAGDRSLDDLAHATRALRRLVAEARDLDGRDLARPGATPAESGIDVAELSARVAAVRATLAAGRERLAAALPARGDVRAAMLSLAGFELSAGVPQATDAAALTAEGTALLAVIDGRLADLAARIDAETPAWDALDELGRVALLRGRLELLVGHALPLAPRFAAADGEALDASFARPRLASREDATGWLAVAGRVDPGARRLRLAVDMVEAVRDEVVFGFSLGQFPDHEEERWAAVRRPTHDERGRLCLLATGHAPRFARGPAAGLVLGAWTEPLVRGGQTAGVTFHFDAPSARAPQAVLVCAAEARGFDFDVVREMLERTLELSQVRMVGPETLQDLGQYLPAAYLHADTATGGVA